MAEITQPGPELMAQIARYQADACEHLELDPAQAPLVLVTAIHDYLAGLKENGGELEPDLTMALGLLLGEQFVRAFGWHWRQAAYGSAAVQTCIVAPGNLVAADAPGWVGDILLSERECNILAAFERVAAGILPRAEAGRAGVFHF